MSEQRKLLYATSLLHKTGYPGVRVDAGLSPSGMHWRFSLKASYLQHSMLYSSSSSNFLGLDLSKATVEDVARALEKEILKEENFAAQAKLDNGEPYQKWLSDFLDKTAPKGVMVMYADYPLQDEVYISVSGSSVQFPQYSKTYVSPNVKTL